MANNYMTWAGQDELNSLSSNFLRRALEKERERLAQLKLERDRLYGEARQKTYTDSRDLGAEGQQYQQMQSYGEYRQAQLAADAYRNAARDFQSRRDSKNPYDAMLWEGRQDDEALAAEAEGGIRAGDDTERDIEAKAASAYGEGQGIWKEKQAQAERERAEKEAAARKWQEDRARSAGYMRTATNTDTDLTQYLGTVAGEFQDPGRDFEQTFGYFSQPHTIFGGNYAPGLRRNRSNNTFGWQDGSKSDAEQDRLYRKYAGKLRSYSQQYGADQGRWKANDDAWRTLNDYYRETRGDRASWDTY